VTIRIEGCKISQHDQAVRLLERVAYSLFFQIDLVLGVSLRLVRFTERPLMGARLRKPYREPVKLLRFPREEYDQEPMALYSYGRSAPGMPLLQYLAYYQTIEFYFPSYYLAEARRKVRNILKDPSFRADRDADVGRILASVRGKGRSFVDERSQLKATLRECLDPHALRAFLTSNEKRKNFFSSKTKRLTDCKIPIKDERADLGEYVAERIYDIRCKIVHTKSEETDKEVEIVLPDSPEADLLYWDIELIQYAAQQVLIAASAPIQI